MLDKLDSQGDFSMDKIKAALHQKKGRDIMEILFSRSRYFLPRAQLYFSKPRLIDRLEFHKRLL